MFRSDASTPLKSYRLNIVVLASQACTTLADAVVILATWLYLHRHVKSQGLNWLRHPQTLSWLFLRDGEY